MEILLLAVHTICHVMDGFGEVAPSVSAFAHQTPVPSYSSPRTEILLT